MADKIENKPSQEELLKAVSDVLDEALAIYEDAVGAPNDVKKSADRPAPSGKMDEGIDAMLNDAVGLSVTAKPLSQPGIGDGSTTGIMAHGSGQGAKAAGMNKAEEDKDKKKDKEDMEKTDAELVTMYKSLVQKMEARGLIRKAEPAAAAIQKSESAPVAAFDDSSLRKSIDERFDAVTNALKGVAETVKKIASQPQGRKGLTGYQPLKKNEGPAPLRKSEVIGKLLELRKSGDPRVSTTFITRIEQGRLAKGDDDTLKALGVITE
jgi:uncharacterized protein YecT (DUF1311 family)